LLVGKLAAIFAGLAIFISCLGLFGTARTSAELLRHALASFVPLELRRSIVPRNFVGAAFLAPPRSWRSLCSAISLVPFASLISLLFNK
jgi:hypothetical protein